MLSCPAQSMQRAPTDRRLRRAHGRRGRLRGPAENPTGSGRPATLRRRAGVPLQLHARAPARRLHRHRGRAAARSAGDRRRALRAPRAHAGDDHAPRAGLAPGLLLRGLRDDRRGAHLARLGQPGPAVHAHDRAPAARRHRRAADRARADRAAARAGPQDQAVRPPARAVAPGDRLSAVGRRPVRVARARSLPGGTAPLRRARARARDVPRPSA